VAVAYLKQTFAPRVVADLKKRSVVGIFIYPIALSVVLFSGGFYFRHLVFSRWFLVLILGVCLFRLIYILIDSRIPAQWNQISQIFFIIGVTLAPLIWGLGFAQMMVLPGEVNTQLLMVTCTIGICSGGGTAFSPNLWLALCFNAFMLWPGILSMALNSVNLPLVVLILIFFTYVFLMSFRANSEYLLALESEALLEQKTKDLEKISHVDGLTGIYNRRYFDTALEIAWQDAVRNKSRLALVICDIDDFKQVNDDFGHLAGDEYLRTIAYTLNQVFKRQTDIVARYGGEEFVVLITQARPGTAVELAETFRQAIESTQVEFESSTIQTTVSLGIAEILPEPGRKKETLISRADIMLYQAKNKGKNRSEVSADYMV
jgi:diguanylate cyclase (GGDEF)-like protein